MGLDYTLLTRAIEESQGNHLYITEDRYGWNIELWDKPSENLIGTYCISQEIQIKTILEFIPKKELTYVTNMPVVQSILKEMKLCQ